MLYWCYLWHSERADKRMMSNMALRKGVRKKLSMKMNESIFMYGLEAHFKNQWKERKVEN